MTAAGPWLFGTVTGWLALLILRPAVTAPLRRRPAVSVLCLLAGCLSIAGFYTGGRGIVEAAFGSMSGALAAAASRVGSRPRS